MSTPTGVPTREKYKQYYKYLTIAGEIFGQLQSFNCTEQIETQDENRLSDDTNYRERVDRAVDWTATFYWQGDMKELGILLGATPAETSGWAAATTLELTTDTTQRNWTITYLDNLTDENVLVVETLVNATPTSLETPWETGTGSQLYTMSGYADRRYWTPTENVGSTS